MYRIPTLISFLIIFSTILSAQTVSVLPSIKDNSMFSESGSKSLGAGKLFTGQTCQGNNRRALIEFDLTGIPTDAVVTSVTLNLGAENSGSNGDGVIEIFGVTKEWGEGFSSGSGNGGPAVAPDATWTDAMFGTSTWDSPGGDFDSAVLSSRFTNENDQVITFPTSSNFVARAQAWVNDPADNHGIIIIGVETATCAAYRFGARDVGTAPELVVTWETSCDPPIEWVIDAELCEDDDFTLNGIVYDQSNPSGTQVFTAANGCDSTIIISLSFIQNSTALIEETLCPGEQITVNGTLYDVNNPSGIEELLNSNGCDSIVTIDLSFFPDAAGEETYAGCANDGYSVVVNGTLYDESQPSGVEIFPGASVNGCDSMVNINLFFQVISQENITHSGCEGNGFSVVVDGVTYDEMNPSGSVFLVSSNGCDSIINIDLFFAPVPNPGIPAMMGEVCNEDDEILDLNTLLTGADAGGVWTETSPNLSTGLSGNEFDGNGQDPGTYFFKYTLSGPNCPDEFTEVAVNVQTPITATVTSTGVVCNNNDPNNTTFFNFNSLITAGFTDGAWIDNDGVGVNLSDLSSVDFLGVSAGNYTFTYLTSIVGNCPEQSYPVTILVEDCTCPSLTGNENYAGCEGDNYEVIVNGTVYNEANPNGIETLISTVTGCDSVVNINLVFATPPNAGTASTPETLCNEADDILDLNTLLIGSDAGGVWTETTTNPSTGFSGNTFDGNGQNPGSYIFRYTVSTANCPDDFTEVTVDVQAPNTATVTSGTVCNNNSGSNSSVINFNGLITAGFANGTWLDSNGSGVDLTNLNSVNFDGIMAGMYVFTYVTPANGNCPENSYTTAISVEDCVMCPPVMSNENYTGCEGDNYEVIINGIAYNETNPSGTEILISTVTGCDSIVNVDLVFLPPATSEAIFATCDLSAPPTTTEVIAGGAFNGCDSIVIFNTFYLPNDETFISASSCDPDDAGMVVENFINQFGCDSMVFTTTILLESDTLDIFAVSCNPADTGIVEIILTNENGCDSIVTTTTVLEPLDISVTVADATIIASQFGGNYQWIDCDNNNEPIMGENDQSYTATVSGNYAVEINQNGCTATSECVMVTVVNTDEVWFADQIDVLPNPTSGAVRLTFGALENVNIRIMEVTGKILLERNKLSGGSADLFLEGPAGLYFVGVEVDGVWGWMKVVKN